MAKARTPYPSDASDAERHFLAPYLVLMREDAPQREHFSRDLLNALRYVVKTSSSSRFLPHDFPPWSAVYQQARRWLDHRVFEAAAHDLRSILRVLDGRNPDPSAAVFDGRTLQSTPESVPISLSPRIIHRDCSCLQQSLRKSCACRQSV